MELRNGSRFLQIVFFRPSGALRTVVATFPGAYGRVAEIGKTASFPQKRESRAIMKLKSKLSCPFWL